MIEHHHWTVEEINAVRLLAEEKMMKPLEIALHTGFTKNAIVGLCFRKNIYLNNKRVFKNKAAPKPPGLCFAKAQDQEMHSLARRCCRCKRKYKVSCCWILRFYYRRTQVSQKLPVPR